MDDDGVCDELEIIGCTDPDACNTTWYDANGNITSELYDVYGNANTLATEDDGSCEYPGDECEGFDQQLQELVYGYLAENCECALPLSIDVFLENKEIIKIFTVSGVLVDEIVVSNQPDNGIVHWDMLTRENLEIAAGMYIYHIDAQHIGEEKVGKFAVIK